MDGAIVPAREALEPRLFDADEFHRMAALGILSPDERVELIEGMVTRMNAIGTRHLNCVLALTELLGPGPARRWALSVQNTVRLGRRSEPQPDVALLRPLARGAWWTAPPGPADILLLIEVADTTLAYDLAVKGPLYARAGVADYWVVDLDGRAVVVHRAAAKGGYADITRAGADATVSSLALPDVALRVADIVGPT